MSRSDTVRINTWSRNSSVASRVPRTICRVLQMAPTSRCEPTAPSRTSTPHRILRQTRLSEEHMLAPVPIRTLSPLSQSPQSDTGGFPGTYLSPFPSPPPMPLFVNHRMPPPGGHKARHPDQRDKRPNKNNMPPWPRAACQLRKPPMVLLLAWSLMSPPEDPVLRITFLDLPRRQAPVAVAVSTSPLIRTVVVPSAKQKRRANRSDPTLQ